MTATIRPDKWLDRLRSDYLDDFIREGGASIKFAVSLDAGVPAQIDGDIAEQARDAGYLVAAVSSADTRVHMMDQVFFHVAEQVPWRQLSELVIGKLASEAGYAPPEPGRESILVRLSTANRLGSQMLLMEARGWVESHIFSQQSLAKDFRVAVSQLCLAELSGGPDGETRIEAITDWLTGRNKAVAAVRPYQIFNRVTRSNARHLFESLLLWIRFAGYPGLVLLMDISGVTIGRNPSHERLLYTKAAMLDAYEVLRQFIDSTDRMKSCLVVVKATPDFLDVESAGRGMGAYDALKFRVYDEVRAEGLVNPMGALVRLSAGGSAA